MHLPYIYNHFYPLSQKMCFKIFIGEIITAGTANLLIFLLLFLIPKGDQAQGQLPVLGLVEIQG